MGFQKPSTTPDYNADVRLVRGREQPIVRCRQHIYRLASRHCPFVPVSSRVSAEGGQAWHHVAGCTQSDVYLDRRTALTSASNLLLAH